MIGRFAHCFSFTVYVFLCAPDLMPHMVRVIMRVIVRLDVTGDGQGGENFSMTTR